jgi:hypothetical protein
VKTWERWTLGLLTLLVSASGFAYLWMKYALSTDDPFAVVNHPWQPLMLSAHVVASPAFILMFGIVLNSHIMKKLGARNSPNRRSGFWSLGSFAVMTATGYLLQVATVERVITALVVCHVASGAIFSAAYLIHLIVSVRLARRADVRPRLVTRSA